MKSVKAFGDKVLAVMIDAPGDYKKTQGGTFIADKDATPEAIRPRWFQVYSVGPKVDWIKKDEYVLVSHGRWSNALRVNDDTKVWLLDNEECLITSDTNPIKDGITV